MCNFMFDDDFEDEDLVNNIEESSHMLIVRKCEAGKKETDEKNELSSVMHPTTNELS